MSNSANVSHYFVCDRCGNVKLASPLHKDNICDECRRIIDGEKFRLELDGISPDIGNKHFVYVLNVNLVDGAVFLFQKDYILIKIDDGIREHLSELLKIVGLDIKQEVTAHSKYILATNLHLDCERAECHLHNKFSKSCEFSRSVILGLTTDYADWSFRYKSASNVLTITVEGIEDVLTFQHAEKITHDEVDVQFILNQLAEASDGCLFRGINNHFSKNDGIAASIYRNNREVAEDGKLQEHELEVVDNLISKDFYRPPEKPTISALTDLRHSGKDTCLLDFSEDSKIALFFSCQPALDSSVRVGEILLLDKVKYKLKEEITYPNSDDFLIRPIKTRITESRVEAQQSIFLYCHQGYVPRDATQAKIRNLLIASSLRSLLYGYCEYTDEKVYPDFYAFIEKPENFMTTVKRESLEKRKDSKDDR